MAHMLFEPGLLFALALLCLLIGWIRFDFYTSGTKALGKPPREVTNSGPKTGQIWQLTVMSTGLTPKGRLPVKSVGWSMGIMMSN